MNGLSKIFYDNRFMDAIPVASSTAAGADYNVLNVREWKPFTVWKPAALPATITVDCGVAKIANYGAIFSHNLGSLGCTAEFHYSTDNFAANDVIAASVTPPDDDDFFSAWADQNKRYWRLRITGPAAPTLAIAAIGSALVLTRRPQRGFGPVNRAVVGQFNVTEGGHPIENVKAYTEWRQTVSLRNVDQAWVRSTLLPAWDAHLENKPFGFAWDPTDHPSELYLVKSEGTLPSPHGQGQYCDVQIALRARTS